MLRRIRSAAADGACYFLGVWLLLSCALINDADLSARMDVDGDGIARPTDCDDDDADVGRPATWYADSDADGYGSAASTEACALPEGYVATPGDCDDANAAASPSADERCDGIDNNCDGVTDEDASVDAVIWYADMDTDAYGDASVTHVSCVSPVGFVANAADCDDLDMGVNPGIREVCDGRDEDCSGFPDDPRWYRDHDDDGYGYALDEITACDAPVGYVIPNTDCDDDAQDVNPGAVEVCDDGNEDENCNGVADGDDETAQGLVETFEDADGDGYGDPTISIYRCDPEGGFVTVGGDCDDGAVGINPGVDDGCYDAVDANCDGFNDYDCDHDGYLSDDWGGADCDDGDSGVSPDAVDACSDAIDNDCDGFAAASCGISGVGALADAPVQFSGDEEDDFFGENMLFGDVTGDGVSDLMVASRSRAPGGRTWMFAGPITGDRASSSADGIWTGENGGNCGMSMAIGDVDADGIADFILGDPGYIPETDRIGRVDVYYGPLSGSVGVAQTTLTGSAEGQWLGIGAVAADFTGDGADDVAIGEYGSGRFAGRVHIVVGGVRGVLTLAGSSLTGENDYDHAGTALAAGDVDGDGAADLAVYAPEAGVYLLRGPVTDSLALAAADVVLANYGGLDGDHPVAITEDLTGDGAPDLVMGDSTAGSFDYTGKVYIFSAPADGATTADAAATATLEGAHTFDYAGAAVAGAGDVDGDGAADLLVGAPNADGDSSYEGRAYLCLGPITGNRDLDTADGTLTASYEDVAGSAVAGLGDLDADGYDDIVVTATGADEGAPDGGTAYFLFGGP